LANNEFLNVTMW